MVQKLRVNLIGLGVLAVVTIAGLGTPLAVYAQQSRDNTTTQQTEPAEAETTNNVTETHNTTETENETHSTDSGKTRAEGKLDTAREKVCTARLNSIKNIMSNASSNGQTILNTFGKIVTRVEDFYTSKKLSVSNYDTLVAAVNAKHDAAVAAVNAVKATVPSFACDSSNPVGVANSFKTQVATMRAALKDYRTAIINLITAVKTAADKAEGSAQ